jgi:hypothetical protein
MAVKASIRAVKSSVFIDSVIAFSEDATLPVRHGTDEEWGGAGTGLSVDMVVTGVITTTFSLMF